MVPTMAGSAHRIDARTQDGFPVLTLSAPDQDLHASFAPGLGMIGASLRHRGEELLASCDGLAAYAERGSTMGIPFLHPWANRLAAREGRILGREIRLPEGTTLVRTDEHGRPIHGLLAASPLWEVTSRGADDERAWLEATLDFGAGEDLVALFPFPHRVDLAVELRRDTLRIRTRVTATGGDDVPVSFGFHPYLTLPSVLREQWEIRLPVERHVVLDDRQLPTGETEPVAPVRGPLGDGTFDDGYDRLTAPPAFSLAAGARRITLTFEGGYPVAQVFAPPGSPFICFEPMTALTNALFAGGFPVATPSQPYEAVFSIAVTAAPE